MNVFDINDVPVPKDRPVLARLQTSYHLTGDYGWVEIQWWETYDRFYVSFDSEAMVDTDTITHWMELPKI